MGTSVDSRVDKTKLMPCYFGKLLKQLINWAVAARKLHKKRESSLQVGRKSSILSMPPQRIHSGANFHTTPSPLPSPHDASAFVWRCSLPLRMERNIGVDLRPNPCNPPSQRLEPTLSLCHRCPGTCPIHGTSSRQRPYWNW